MADQSGCTIATASYNTNGGPNCAIYGGALTTMSSSDAEFTVAMIAGTCEQFSATTICMSRQASQADVDSPKAGQRRMLFCSDRSMMATLMKLACLSVSSMVLCVLPDLQDFESIRQDTKTQKKKLPPTDYE
jgi:hypothetical protein